MSGMEVLNTIRTAYPDTAVVMVTAVNNVDVVVEAMKLGASDYIVKPFDLDKVYTSIRMAAEAKQESTEKRGYKIPLYLEREEENESSAEGAISCIDAIAHGVEARLDQLVGYSVMVNKRTIEVARELGMPEKEIQRWSAVRSEHEAERNTAIKASLDKLQRSPLVQCIMGLAVPYMRMPKLDESQN